MALIIFAPPLVTARLSRIASKVTDVYTARCWDEFESTIRTNSVSLAIVDPTADGTFRIEKAAELIEKNPSLYFILYPSLRARNISSILQLSRRGLREVMTQGVDDSPVLLRDKIERLEGAALARTSFVLVPSLFGKLSPDITKAVQRLFQNPLAFRGARDLAREAGVPLSRLYRSLELANLSTPRDLLVAARVWHGYSYLSEPNRSVSDVAVKLGYNQRRIFVSHTMMVFGLPPSELRARLSATKARRCVSRWLRKHDNRRTR